MEVNPTVEQGSEQDRFLADLACGERLSRRALLKRAGAAGATVVIGPSLLAGCTYRQSGDANTLTAALATDFQSFDPADATTVTSFTINAHVFEPLVEISSSTRELSPALATAMPERLSSRRYRVRLREGAQFHDGSPVTTEDVLFSFDRVLDEERESFFRQFVDFIDRVEVVDDAIVEFRLRYPTNLLEPRLPVVKIVPRAVVQRVTPERFALEPVGSGPYRFVSAQSNNRIVLERFRPYNGPRPGSIGRLVLTIQPDASSRVSSLRSGQVQVVEAPLDRDIAAIKDSEGLEARAVPGFTMSFLMYNCRRPAFRDPRVRQALHWAINRDLINEYIFLGNARSAVSYLPENHPAFVRPRTVYQHDPERARSLLVAAGYGPERPLRFTLQVFSDVPWIANSFTVIRENWADVGVQVQSRGGGEDLYSNVVDKGDYDAFLALADQSLFGWDAGTLLSWHYGEQWSENLYFWDVPEKRRMLDLLDRARRTVDADQQASVYGEIQQLAAEQVPLYPVHHRDAATGWSAERLSRLDLTRTAGLDLRSAQLEA